MTRRERTASAAPDGLPLADDRRVLRELLSCAGPHRAAALWSVALASAGAALFLVRPAMVGEATGLVSGEGGSLALLVLLGALTVLVAPTAEALQTRMSFGFGLAVYRELTRTSVARTLKAEPREVERAGASAFTSRAVHDARRVEDLVANGVPSVLLLGVNALAGAVFLWLLSPVLVLPLLAAVAVTAAAVGLHLPRAAAVNLRLVGADAAVTARTSELAFGGALLAQAGWLQETRRDAVRAIDGRFTVQTEDRRLVKELNLVQGFAAALLVVGPVLLALAAPQGAVSAAAVASAAALGASLKNPLNELAFWAGEVQMCRLVFRRVIGLGLVPQVGEPEGRPDRKETAANALECRGLVFSYPSAARDGKPRTEAAATLRGVDLRVPPGAHAAVVGLSGAGKSTLIRILAGQLVPDRGDVRIEGLPPQEARRSLGPDGRPQMLYVCQEPFYFAGSVVENVLMGPDGSGGRAAEEVGELICGAGLDSLADMDLEAAMTRDDLTVKQLRDISLLRVLWRRPAVVLIDEAFAGNSLQEQERILSAFPEGTTTVSVVHDLALLPAFDAVLRMQDGVLVSEDSPEVGTRG